MYYWITILLLLQKKYFYDEKWLLVNAKKWVGLGGIFFFFFFASAYECERASNNVGKKYLFLESYTEFTNSQYIMKADTFLCCRNQYVALINTKQSQ